MTGSLSRVPPTAARCRKGLGAPVAPTLQGLNLWSLFYQRISLHRGEFGGGFG